MGDSATRYNPYYFGGEPIWVTAKKQGVKSASIYGEAGVAAYSIIMYIGYIFAAVLMGYNLTVSPVVAYNYGAANKDELHSLLHKSFRLLLLLGIGLTVTAELTANPAARLFVGYDADMVALASRAERINCRL